MNMNVRKIVEEESDYQRRLAQRVEELNEFQRAFLDLDCALTGHSPTDVVKQMHHYPVSLEHWIKQAPSSNLDWYLSDGGYSRLAWSWDDKDLFLTSNSRSEVKANWDAALPQRQRVEAVILKEWKALE